MKEDEEQEEGEEERKSLRKYYRNKYLPLDQKLLHAKVFFSHIKSQQFQSAFSKGLKDLNLTHHFLLWDLV